MIVLASASQDRYRLLQTLKISEIERLPADIDETPLKKERPSAYVMRLARTKAEAVQKIRPGRFILGGDTALALGRRIFHKAADADEARQQITQFSGRRHRVYTGVCLITPEGKVCARLAQTVVSFKRLSAQEIDAFVDSGEWEGVCVYRIQGVVSAFLKFMRGTVSNVQGLPLYEVSQMLQGNNYPHWTQEKESPS